MKYDFYRKLYQKNAAFIESRPYFKKALPFVNKGLTAFFFASYTALVAYAFFKDFGATDFMKILFPPLVCLFFVSVLQLAIHKPRPYTAEGANITPLFEKKRGDYQSFPSRHVASAVVIAGVFLRFFPAFAFVLYPLALVLAYARFAVGFHYIFDLAAGGVIGACIGLLVFVL